MEVKKHSVGIIMNGVTGRMGTNQHLMRSIVEIIRQGGVQRFMVLADLPACQHYGRQGRRVGLR